MASLSTDKNGNRSIQFVGGDGRQRTVRLGKVPKKLAESVKLKVEHLNALAVARLPLDTDTAVWAAGIGDDLAAKLAAVGLLPGREQAVTVGRFLAGYLDRRRAGGGKPNSVANAERVVQDLIAVFGADTRVRDVGPADAERVRTVYLDRKLAPATVHRRLRFARTLFTLAVRQKLVIENPFADVTVPNCVPVDRRVYVPAADVERVIAAANPTWRVILALSRYAGLRCPSEVVTLKWADVNFAANRMTVTSPKTEHIVGKEYRVVPIFAALRPHLEEAFELAEPGAVYVVGGPQGDGYRASAAIGWKGTNLRSACLKLIRRAGLMPWPKPFHNLRASCETDLMQHHPIHVVTAWVGNTPSIALGHYLQTLESDFEKAVRGSAAKSGAVAVRNKVQSAIAGNELEMTGVPEKPDPSVILASTVVLSQLRSLLDSEPEYPRQDSNL